MLTARYFTNGQATSKLIASGLGNIHSNLACGEMRGQPVEGEGMAHMTIAPSQCFGRAQCVEDAFLDGLDGRGEESPHHIGFGNQRGNRGGG